MNHAVTRTAITSDTWTKVAEFTSNQPKGISVQNLASSLNDAQILVKPNNAESIETDPDDGSDIGWTLSAGASKSYFKAKSGGGDGMITQVWARSAGATVEVTEDA